MNRRLHRAAELQFVRVLKVKRKLSFLGGTNNSGYWFDVRFCLRVLSVCQLIIYYIIIIYYTMNYFFFLFFPNRGRFARACALEQRWVACACK